MRRLIRRSAFVLVAASAVAAAYAALPSGLPAHVARLHLPRLAAVDEGPAAPQPAAAKVAGPATERTAAPRARVEPCESGACGDPLVDSLAEGLGALDLSLAEGERPDLDQSAPLAVTGFDAASDGLANDPNPLYLASFAPSASAQPTPEISTAAMVTFGLAGVVWTARRTRRATLRTALNPRFC